jgi:formylglycine-generating enzyme required for sulfatase activity
LVDEWFAACSDGGKQVYPYGKSYAPTTCNGADAAGDEAVFVGTLPGCVTPDGVADLSGNVWEWEDSCVGDSSMDDGCAVRGGGFNNDAANLTCATADPRPRGAQAVNIGFRCCAPVLPEDS